MDVMPEPEPKHEPREISIKLLCPSVNQVTQVVAWADQKIDLGFISRAFGLDPSTLRLNGYFISRGVDLVASSLTWKSLLSFFSSKGLASGEDHRHPLLVTGNFCKLAHKRGHNSQDFRNGIGKMMEGENAGNSRGIQPEVVNLLKNKKLKLSNSGDLLKSQSCKRKQLLEDVNIFKKLKINEDKSDTGDKVDDLAHSIAHSQLTCSHASKNRKRIREDETMTVNYKRIR